MQQELNLIKTGYTKLDELIGEFSTGEVMLISGPNIYEEEQLEKIGNLDEYLNEE